MPQSVVTAELKDQAVQMAREENAPQETVDLLMGMKAKDLVKWMKERRTKVVSPPSGEQGHDEEGCEVLVNRFSAMFKNE
jgi:hypothetical protein